MYGPAILIDNSSTTWEIAKVLEQCDPVYDNGERLGQFDFFFGSRVLGAKMVMENRWQEATRTILLAWPKF